ncbi:flagellin [Clostridium algidicarnis]|uniref:Flagellin n=1 Tax=Clostridium algidicarnis DSM 15099 TaxID=1121295 RepID=A0A2S6FV27_9CLOT|nr:flagellin [Clostridium algidicarnis]PPK45259.1 flagellin [Clostridium algidicarnis DSM 15099]
MIINHNMGAMNANRMMGINQANAGKSMEKLSSGLRINRAGDDAAGLAISEKMRGQIRGLDQAAANAQDAISLTQTAEGALSETHSILQRMRELAVQSSTDTNTSDDRNKIQSEVDQLAKEITRISNTTEFNTQNLLAGGLSDKFQIGSNASQNISLSVNAMDAQSLGVADSTKSTDTFVNTNTKLATVGNAGRGLDKGTAYKVVTTVNAAAAGAVSTDSEAATNGGALAVTTDTAYTGTSNATYLVKVGSVDSAADNNTATSIQYSKDNGTSWTTVTADASAGITVDGMKFTMAKGVGNQWSVGDQYHFTATAANATIQLQDTSSANIGTATTVHYGDKKATIGSSATGKTVDTTFDFSKIIAGTDTFNVDEVTSDAAVVNDGKVVTDATAAAGINLSSQDKANTAITKIDNAINTVSQERSKLGAFTNRLEHTIANLGTSSENLTSAESRIRDVNMAKEMSTFSKNNILSQAAQAMLAQANQQPQQVLQLLR